MTNGVFQSKNSQNQLLIPFSFVGSNVNFDLYTCVHAPVHAGIYYLNWINYLLIALNLNYVLQLMLLFILINVLYLFVPFILGVV